MTIRHAILPILLATLGAAHAQQQPVPHFQPSIGTNFSIISDSSGPGVITAFAGNYIPGTNLAPNGQDVDIVNYPELGTSLGVNYGSVILDPGKVVLPDLRNRVALGTGAPAGLTDRPIGTGSGTSEALITNAQLPPSAGGSGDPTPITQPGLTMRYFIAKSGFFPSGGGGGSIAIPFIGQIVLSASSDAPSADFIPAEGQLLSIQDNVEFFQAIGSTFGGDGTTTFAMPDLRARTSIGTGFSVSSDTRLGDQRGTETITLQAANLPDVGTPIDLVQPSLGIDTYIVIDGLFPSQNSGTNFGGDALYVGQLITAGFDSAMWQPGGLQKANGALLEISQYQNLFDVIGTTYGGNGVTTFQLPDYSGRAPVGIGEDSPFGPDVSLGQTFGSEKLSLTEDQIPAAVPEPATLILLGFATLALLATQRRRCA